MTIENRLKEITNNLPELVKEFNDTRDEIDSFQDLLDDIDAGIHVAIRIELSKHFGELDIKTSYQKRCQIASQFTPKLAQQRIETLYEEYLEWKQNQLSEQKKAKE